MNNEELRELVHLLLMCGIMDKTALESGNVTNEEWLRMKNLIDKYQAEKEVHEPQGDLISRSALKNKFISTISVGRLEFEDIINLIDNAPTVEPDMEFAKWVADQIFFKEVEDDLFVELACRKLEKLGLVEKTESEWIKRGGDNETDN